MDLLEVIPIQSYDRHMNTTITHEVDFLHRTVRDFFRVKEIQLWIEDHLPKGFNPSDALSRAFLAQLKTLLFEIPDLYEKGKVTDLVDNMMHYVHEVETQTGAASIPVVDELSRVMETYIANSREQPMLPNTNLHHSLDEVRYSFLGFAVQRDLQLYVAEKLDDRSVESHSDYSYLVLAAFRRARAWREKTCNSRYGTLTA